MSEAEAAEVDGNEKLRIVLTCIQPGVEVSEVCRREGINPTMFYNWKKRLMASASQVFEEKPKKRTWSGSVWSGNGPAEGRDRGDHGREPGAKKNAFGLEDHGKMPPELQQQVHAEVKRSKERSGWPAEEDPGGLGSDADDVLSLAA